jgi:hypothetical protein
VAGVLPQDGLAVTPEQAEKLYYATIHAEGKAAMEANNPALQRQIQSKAWGSVISACRKEYEAENERLREENRSLKEVILTTVEADACA